MADNNNNKLIVAVSPYIHSGENISSVMRDVVIALLPAVAFSFYYYGLFSLRVIAVSVITAVITEYIWQRSLKLEVRIKDFSAMLTGLLLALVLPPSLPWWMVMTGSSFAVIFGKQVFGGLGHNPFNPALIARAFLQIAWPSEMTSWIKPFESITTATPLAIKKMGIVLEIPSNFELLIGNHAGSLGEASALALAAGGLFLIIRKHILPVIPLTYVITVAIGAYIFGQDPVFHILSGGLLIGAVFMATDPVTSPVSVKGKFIFAFGCGLLTTLIRFKGGFPEGVCFSILIMNITVPIIDMYTIPERFGSKT